MDIQSESQRFSFENFKSVEEKSMICRQLRDVFCGGLNDFFGHGLDSCQSM
jgi:hypothetical protein